MAPVTFRGGRLAPDYSKPRLLLGPRLELGAVIPAAPPARDWCTAAGPYDMLGNADWGDCVLAEAGHHEQSVSTFGAKTPVRLTTDEVLTAYSAITGFDPHAGPPGSNPTDRGTNMQRALGYWRKKGIGGRKILAFAEVNVHNLSEVVAAIEVFGALAVGVNLPAAAMDQFNAGESWTVLTDDGGIEGGHAVHVAGFDRDAKTFTLTTWGRVTTMTWAWWLAYVEEAWVPVLPEWLDATGHSPAGLDLQGLGADFATLTGDPNPFPTQVPPAPVVPPFRDLVVAVEALAGDPESVGWLTRHHHGEPHQTPALLAAVLAAPRA